MTVSFLRHAGWVSPEILTDNINIIGCGALGSHVALVAAKMGFTSFTLWDNDIVEAHNLPNQAYDHNQLGMSKVDALEVVLQRFNPEIKVEKHNYFFESQHAPQLKGYVVSAVDSMSGRKLLLNAIEYNPSVSLLAEARLGFDYAEVNLVKPMSFSNISNFSQGLVDDSEVPDGPCNLRLCSTLVFLVAGYLVHQICAFAYSASHGTKWDYAWKNVFYLNPIMTNINFKEEQL